MRTTGVALCLFIAGCEPGLWQQASSPTPARTWFSQTADEQAFEASAGAGVIDVREHADAVEIFESDAVRPTQIIGLIGVRQPIASHDDALAALRRAASRVGADAVVHVEMHRDDRASEQTVTLSGVAVRYGDILAGRGYVVLGEIEVDGHSDEADVLAAMRERARAVGADAVVGVHLQRGNSGGTLRAQGTAIRFGG